MEVIAYGEDSITLWALTHRLNDVLAPLGDDSDPARCRAFYRPSFGRSGGSTSSQFGEFDFVLLADHHVYLGESKWDRSPGAARGVIKLSGVQSIRHQILAVYIAQWLSQPHQTWSAFALALATNPHWQSLRRRIPGAKTLLTANLTTFLTFIADHYRGRPHPRICDILLYLHDSALRPQIPKLNAPGFTLVPMSYSPATVDNFIRLCP